MTEVLCDGYYYQAKDCPKNDDEHCQNHCPKNKDNSTLDGPEIDESECDEYEVIVEWDRECNYCGLVFDTESITYTRDD